MDNIIGYIMGIIANKGTAFIIGYITGSILTKIVDKYINTEPLKRRKK